ncbi:MAG TPA: PaaI family thioesterase [Blastocatellia bacterium]|nr:PaaI family thioesterase [Blastocatellia bacterium]
MPIQERDDHWPYVEQMTPARAADQRDRVGPLTLFHSIGLRLEKLAKDYTKVSIAPRPELARPRGMLQGGVLATLVDAAAGQALRTTLKLDYDAVTVHLDTKYFRPVYEERLFAEGSVVRKGRDLAHIDVTVINEEGALVARGWCVLKITRRNESVVPDFDLPKPTAGVLQAGLGI